MSNITKRQALTECLGLWKWLAENPSEEKNSWPGWGRKFRIHNCPCCEYMREHHMNIYSIYTKPCQLNEKYCLIDWDTVNGAPGKVPCERRGAAYANWMDALHPLARREYALEIVRLAEKALKELK